MDLLNAARQRNQKQGDPLVLVSLPSMLWRPVPTLSALPWAQEPPSNTRDWEEGGWPWACPATLPCIHVSSSWGQPPTPGCEAANLYLQVAHALDMLDPSTGPQNKVEFVVV